MTQLERPALATAVRARAATQGRAHHPAAAAGPLLTQGQLEQRSFVCRRSVKDDRVGKVSFLSGQGAADDREPPSAPQTERLRVSVLRPVQSTGGRRIAANRRPHCPCPPSWSNRWWLLSAERVHVNKGGEGARLTAVCVDELPNANAVQCAVCHCNKSGPLVVDHPNKALLT